MWMTHFFDDPHPSNTSTIFGTAQSAAILSNVTLCVSVFDAAGRACLRPHAARNRRIAGTANERGGSTSRPFVVRPGHRLTHCGAPMRATWALACETTTVAVLRLRSHDLVWIGCCPAFAKTSSEIKCWGCLLLCFAITSGGTRRASDHNCGGRAERCRRRQSGGTPC